MPARDAASTATVAVAIRRIMVPFARDLLTVNCRATAHLANAEPRTSTVECTTGAPEVLMVLTIETAFLRRSP